MTEVIKMLLDPLSDALSNMKNNEFTGNLDCVVKPASKLTGAVLNVMQGYGYIDGFEFIDDGKSGKFKVKLVGKINKCGVIRPRYSVGNKNLLDFEKRFLPAMNFGILIMTTSRGVMSHVEAKKKGIGGKLLAFVY